MVTALVNTAGNARKPPSTSPSWASMNSRCSAGLDLLAAALRQGRIVGLVDHLLADLDQPALESEVVQQAPVVVGVDDALGGAREAGEILRAVQIAQRLVVLERDLQGDVIGEPAAFDQAGHGREDPAVHRLVEMLGPQVLADPVIGFVVDQDRAEQRLLGLDIVRLGAKAGRAARIAASVEGSVMPWARSYHEPVSRNALMCPQECGSRGRRRRLQKPRRNPLLSSRDPWRARPNPG